MGKTKVFLDSDVIVSALLSKKGASWEIINNKDIKRVTSTAVKKEVQEVIKRHDISFPLEKLLQEVEVIEIAIDKPRLVEKYLKYVFDKEDSHVVAVAKDINAQFLLTHNTRHYRVEEISRDLKITTLKPGVFLQSQRSN